MSMRERIGFMQGRLSPQVDGKIQAFPAEHWRAEFPAAEVLGIPALEWTLDRNGLRENPFNTPAGRGEIRSLSARHGVRVPSVTGDCFMQAPFWKAGSGTREELLEEFDLVLASAGELGVAHVVVPLVDNGAIETPEQEDTLLRAIEARDGALEAMGVGIVFESDFAPERLAHFVARFPGTVGINYDIGNSAALGFDPRIEIASYSGRIRNVHVKDRLRGGTTVPLGRGAADLGGAIAALEAAGYAGRYVLQTARAADDDHTGALTRYRDMLIGWIEGAGA